MKQSIKSLIFTLVRMVVGIGIAIFLVSRTMEKANMSPADLWTQICAASPVLLVLAVLIHGVVLAINALRWRILLNAQDVPARWTDTFRLTLIGFFFNLAVPGAVGGDVAKVGYLAKDRSGKATEAIFSIVVDRLIGILGLFFVASGCIILAWPALQALPDDCGYIRGAAVVVGLGSIAGILGLIALEFHDRLIALPGLRRVWPAINRFTPGKIAETVTRLIAAVDTYRRSKPALTKAILLSLCVHLSLALNLYTVGKAMGENQVATREYFLTTQVSNAISSVPITPGGLGLRDRSNQEFLSAFGMAPEKAAVIPITMTLVILTWAMVGLAVFIIVPGRKPADPAEEEALTPPGSP